MSLGWGSPCWGCWCVFLLSFLCADLFYLGGCFLNERGAHGRLSPTDPQAFPNDWLRGAEDWTGGRSAISHGSQVPLRSGTASK